MVTTELSYNPYLLETIVKFNGKSPQVNSLVEKYQNSMLQEWIKEIPNIFYDEMNGYDFEIEFSGTRLDYEELCRVFKDAGIDESQVRLLLEFLLACNISN